tara:strand:+ start:664 stop:1602 length:939 start_codon:yes stop_codon:yes gene_type:complete
MCKDERVTLTVTQLKEKLRSEGLPVSGNKSELILRLRQNKKDIHIESKPKSTSDFSKEKAPSSDLPFLTSLIKNGISSVEIDKNEAIRYGVSFAMLVLIIIGLNSTSWYNYDHSGKSGIPFGSGEYSWQEEIGLGLFSFEITTSDPDSNDDAQILGQTASHSYDGLWCETDSTPFVCSHFSSIGTLNSLMLWFSLLSILTLFVIAIAQGMGKLEEGFVFENKDLIEKTTRILSTFPLLVGTLLYGIIASTASFGGGIRSSFSIGDIESTSGLGGMWWVMFIFSIAHINYIYLGKIQDLVERFKSKISKPSND